MIRNKKLVAAFSLMSVTGLAVGMVGTARAQASVSRAGIRLLDEKNSDDKKTEDKKGDNEKDEAKDRTTIPVEKLPKAVVTGVKKEMPGARITKAAKVEKDNKTTYYLDNVKVGKKAWDVTVAEDGKIIKKEECHDDD